MRTEKYDVVVVGGGAAGVAAAVGSSRRGARTLLVERYGFLGGEAANANVLSYCGFYVRGDACRRVVGGVGAAVLSELAALGFDVDPIRAPSGNWIVMLDPEAIKYAIDRVAAVDGLDCRLHCSLVGAHTAAGRLHAVSLHDGAGRFDVEAGAFVDASGDANLGFAAGVPPMRDLQPERVRQVASFPVRFCGVPPEVSVDRAELAALMPDFRSLKPVMCKKLPISNVTSRQWTFLCLSVVMNSRLLSTRFSLYNGAQEKTMDNASFFVMVDSALLCVFTK